MLINCTENESASVHSFYYHRKDVSQKLLKKSKNKNTLLSLTYIFLVDFHTKIGFLIVQNSCPARPKEETINSIVFSLQKILLVLLSFILKTFSKDIKYYFSYFLKNYHLLNNVFFLCFVFLTCCARCLTLLKENKFNS